MPSLAIVVDSDASLPSELANEHNIRQVPIIVHFGQESLRTNLDIDDAQLFARVDREGKLPTTSAPSPGQFAEAFEDALDSGADAVLCICVSSEISGTFGSACVARDMFPDKDIRVLDSRTVTMCQGFMAVAAAKAADQGATIEECVEIATSVGARSHVFGALSTVKYLAMSGRVGHLAAGMASLLNIKPILTLQDGKLGLLERVRTRKKAWQRLIALTREVVGSGSIEHLAIVHSNRPEEAQQFYELVHDHLPCPDTVVTAEVSAGLSVHTGAGLVALALVKTD